jgi:hypothetical protein
MVHLNCLNYNAEAAHIHVLNFSQRMLSNDGLCLGLYTMWWENDPTFLSNVSEERTAFIFRETELV